MAGIIKATDRQPPNDCSAFRFSELSGEVAATQADSVAQATQIIAQAKREADEIRRQAEQEGRAAAQAASETVCHDVVEQRLSALATTIDGVARAVDQARTEWLAHWEKTAVHLAALMAERVIRCELERKPRIAEGLVREALELAAGSGDLQLRLHPEDYDSLRPYSERVCGELARLGRVEIVADPTISPGGCRVDSQFGAIDQQFESQLARIEQELS